MRFFGFGKKQPIGQAPPPPPSPEPQAHQPTASRTKAIVVYGTSDGARCRQLRDLLEKRGYAYQDIRVDEDLSMRSWLQRTTGDDALPKLFVGATCHGGFEAVRMLVFDGRFDRILHGEPDQADAPDRFAALNATTDATTLHTLLRRGDTLVIKEGEMVTEAWAEPFANPPLVYYEGAPHPIEALDSIVQQIIARLEAGAIEVSWKDDD
jgi:glutaredoxin 3